MQDIIIIGAGGFGRELHALLWDCFPADQFRLKGFLAQRKDELDGFELDAPILDTPEDYRPAADDRFLLAIGNVPARKRTVESLVDRGATFVTMIHPSACITATATIGQGSVVYPFAAVSNRAVVGEYVCVHYYSLVGHDAQVGQYCYLSPYATLNGGSSVEDEVFMGTHSTVTPLKRAGSRCKISANSCLMHDAPADSLVFGVPGRIMPQK